MTEPASSPEDGLDFSAPATAPSAPTCVGCQRSITDQYWTAGDAVLCRECQEKVAAGPAASSDLLSRSTRFSRAVLYGFGGMLLGAGIWYAVIKLTDYEIGIIAILLGWLVAKGILKATGNRGGRRYQILAVCLTYLGIGSSYLPFALNGMSDEPPAAITNSPPAASKDVATMTPEEAAAEQARLDSLIAGGGQSPAPTEKTGRGILGLVFAIGYLALALPVMVVVGSFPSSIISLLLYSFALMRAWQMTAARQVSLAGPFQVGNAPA